MTKIIGPPDIIGVVDNLTVRRYCSLKTKDLFCSYPRTTSMEPQLKRTSRHYLGGGLSSG